MEGSSNFVEQVEQRLLPETKSKIPGKQVFIGFIAMVTLPLITIGFLIAEYLPTDKRYHNINHNWGQGLLCIYMFVSVVAILAFVKRTSVFVCADDSDEDNQHHSNQYLTASVYVFGMGTIFLRIQDLYSYTYCYDLNTDIPFSLFSLIYTFVQVAFIQLFNGRKMTYHCISYLSFFLFIGTNISTYFTYIPYEMKLEMLSSTNDSALESSCVNGNQSIPIMFYKLKHLLVPFVSEFSLICIGVLFTIIRSVRIPQNQCLNGNVTPPISIRSRSQNPNKVRRPPTWNPGLLIGITLSFLLLTCYQAGETQMHGNGVNIWVYYSFLILLNVLLLLVLWILQRRITIGFSILKEIRADDVLIIFSLAGPIIWGILVTLAAILQIIETRGNETTPILAVLCCIIEMGTVGFQTLVLIGYQHQTRKFRNMDRLKQLFYFITTVNLKYWVVDSFIGLRTSSIHLYPMALDVYGDTWSYVSSFLYVLAIFYRFHAALISYEITVSKFGYTEE